MLQELADHGVEFYSLKYALDLSTSHGRLMMHMLAAFAQFEADLIKTRDAAGIVNVRAEGKRLGRPKLHDDQAIRKMRAEGLTYRAIQERLGAPMGYISRAIRGAPISLSKSASTAPGNSPG